MLKKHAKACRFFVLNNTQSKTSLYKKDLHMTIGRVVSRLGLATALLVAVSPGAFAQSSILNASYDVSRELYKEINPAFVASWKKSSGSDIEVKQAHGGSTKQAQAVAEGLEADVVTLNQPTDLDFLVSKGAVASDWRTKFPNGAAPYTTTTVFLVRKGNPKGIADWDDLVKSGTSVVIPNPKTSGTDAIPILRPGVMRLISSDQTKRHETSLASFSPTFRYLMAADAAPRRALRSALSATFS